MSKVNEALHSASGKNFPTFRRGVALYSAQDIRDDPVCLTGKEYKLELKIGTVVKVPEDRMLLFLMKQARLSLIHHVFGEFVPQIHKIREALLDYDIEAALNEVSSLENRMFNVD